MAREMIGIIGGSGLYQMDGVKLTGEKFVETPFGKPSDSIMLGQLNGFDVAFLPRHGRGHKILPHEINYRANVFAMKMLGVNSIISVSAVGSMKWKPSSERRYTSSSNFGNCPAVSPHS